MIEDMALTYWTQDWVMQAHKKRVCVTSQSFRERELDVCVQTN